MNQESWLMLPKTDIYLDHSRALEIQDIWEDAGSPQKTAATKVLRGALPGVAVWTPSPSP